MRTRWATIIALLGLSVLYEGQLQLHSMLSIRSGAELAGKLMNFSVLAVQIIGYFFFLRKERRGWILSVGYACYISMASLLSLVALVRYGLWSDFVKHIGHLALVVVALILLLSPPIKRMYRIDRQMVTRTILVSLCITICYCAFVVGFFIYCTTGNI